MIFFTVTNVVVLHVFKKRAWVLATSATIYLLENGLIYAHAGIHVYY